MLPDSHVIKTLPIELAVAAQLPVTQKSVIVGHFLGVDHIGHRFGIEHPEMRRKVADMVCVDGSTVSLGGVCVSMFVCGH